MLYTSLQVSIKEGRHFWLDLKGTTVPPQFPMLYVPTGEILNPETPFLWQLRATYIPPSQMIRNDRLNIFSGERYERNAGMVRSGFFQRIHEHNGVLLE